MGATPNTLPTKSTWSKVFQLNHYKVPVYPILASEDLRSELSDGATVKRTYNAGGSTGKMAGDGGFNARPYVNVEEEITINQKDYYAANFPSWEKLLWHLDNDRQFAELATRLVHNQTDANVLNTVRAGAATALDDGSLSGTSGNGITCSIANIESIFTKANEILRLQNVDYPANVPYTGNVRVDKRRKMKVAIVPPHVANYLEQYIGGKNSSLGDRVSENGYMQMFHGFNVFTSNNLPFSATLTCTADIGNSETIVIAGVTFTFLTTLGSTAGNVHSTGTLADTLTNFAAALNAPFTSITEAAAAGYVALTATEVNTTAKELVFGRPGDTTGDPQINISATATATTLTIVVKGVNKVAVSDTAANATWTSALQIAHGIFGVSKCVDLIMKRDPLMDVNPVSGKIAKDFVCWDLYGLKVFKDQTYMSLNAKFDVSASAISAPNQTPLG